MFNIDELRVPVIAGCRMRKRCKLYLRSVSAGRRVVVCEKAALASVEGVLCKTRALGRSICSQNMLCVAFESQKNVLAKVRCTVDVRRSGAIGWA